MIFSVRRDWVSMLLLAAMFVAAAAAWPGAPERVPVHWDVHGAPDRWGGRAEGLVLLPVVALGLWLLTILLPLVDPARANYARFAGAYAVLRGALVGFLALTHAAVLAEVHGLEGVVGRVVPVAVGALFLALASVLGKVRPTWFVGVRTPWTLTSERAWTRTHRVAAWIVGVTGGVVLVAGLVSPPLAFAAMIGGIVVMLGTSLAYSWWVWRGDPERRAL